MINRVRKHCSLSFESFLEVEKKGIFCEVAEGCVSKRIRDYWLLMMVCRERNAFKSLKHIMSFKFKSFELDNERVPKIEQ